MHTKRLINVFADHYDVLSQYAIMIVKNKEAALDVMQNVALTIAKNEPMIEQIYNPRYFLIVCVRRAALNHLRKELRAYPVDPAYIQELKSDECAHNETDYLEWVMALDKYLEIYPEKLRKAFVRHYVDGYPAEIVAKELGMTPNALAQQFKRMRKKIEQRAPEHHTLLVFLSYL